MAILIGDHEWRPEDAVLRALPWLTLGLGLLMVSKLPYAHATNRFLKGRKPVTFVVISLVVLILALTYHFEAALAGAMVVYALSGPAVALFRMRRRAGEPVAPGKGGA